ncbi:putative ribonuclease p 40kda subunit [Golovinomyces cichoracearum]|uniref:Putative ribonuclease p 40kda subunit n=1 Tax=Golovinomyces cichoracearum TaxID=62708 RepID=A0A420IXI7_9PEZI|nr:putative ribonuclease p 40kda subunit [Golovinomyces cichoracearum]
MLNFPLDKKKKHVTKCHVTHGKMSHLDPKQIPIKKKPFSAILRHKFIQRIELVIPEELYVTIEEKFFTKHHTSPNYCRVIIPLLALLERDFFNEYIKKGLSSIFVVPFLFPSSPLFFTDSVCFLVGNILMLSEGRIGAENVYLLKDGKLSLHLDKQSYESAGLVGKPENDKAERYLKNRWLVEIDLRCPSMQHGKKGFDRIVYAFENVLKNPVTWLFCDLGSSNLVSDPLDKHFPVKKTAIPQVTRDVIVQIPSLKPPIATDPEFNTDFYYYAMELHEWFSLVMLDSPRINKDDEIDPVLSRYSPPGQTSVARLVKVVWRGFIPPPWIHRLFVEVFLATPREQWFTINVCGFPETVLGESKDSMILKPANKSREYVLWETI